MNCTCKIIHIGGSVEYDYDCPDHGLVAWTLGKNQPKIETCEHCGGSGILNVEVMDEQYSPYDGMRVTTWEPKARSCHGCLAGKEWEGLLE